MTEHPIHHEHEVKLIAHGGYSAKYPENTLVSYQEAAKFQPYAIEMDVVVDPVTKKLVCYHPKGISSEHGTYDAHSVEKQLHHHSEFPLLSDVLKTVTGNHKFLIDFKQPSVEAYWALLTDPEIDISNIVVGVRNLEDLKVITSISPNIEALGLFADPSEYQSFKDQGGKYFRLWEKDATDEVVKAIQAAGLEVWITPGHKETPTQPRTAGQVSPEKLEQFTGLAVNAILVNDIEEVSKNLRRA